MGNVKKTVISAVAAAGLAVGMALAVPATASATEDCIPQDAWTETVVIKAEHWQRYSWTGGPHEPDTPPVEVPPHKNWQANTASDPHGIGQAGPYFRSHGNSGKGDWFYLELIPAVTETIDHPAVVCPDPEPVPEEPVEEEPVEEPSPESGDELPATGGSMTGGLLGALALLGLAGATMLVRRFV